MGREAKIDKRSRKRGDQKKGKSCAETGRGAPNTRDLRRRSREKRKKKEENGAIPVREKKKSARAVTEKEEEEARP